MLINPPKKCYFPTSAQKSLLNRFYNSCGSP